MPETVKMFGKNDSNDFSYLLKPADNIGLVLKSGKGDYNDHRLYHAVHENRKNQYKKWVGGMPEILTAEDALTVQHLIAVPHYMTVEEGQDDLDHTERVMVLGEMGMIAHRNTGYTFPDDDGIWTPNGFIKLCDSLTDTDSKRFGWLQKSQMKVFAEMLLRDGKGEKIEGEDAKEL